MESIKAFIENLIETAREMNIEADTWLKNQTSYTCLAVGFVIGFIVSKIF